MNADATLMKLEAKIEKRLDELQELAHRYRYIDNYDEIARLRELQTLQRFFNQLQGKENKS